MTIDLCTLFYLFFHITELLKCLDYTIVQKKLLLMLCHLSSLRAFRKSLLCFLRLTLLRGKGGHIRPSLLLLLPRL